MLSAEALEYFVNIFKYVDEPSFASSRVTGIVKTKNIAECQRLIELLSTAGIHPASLPVLEDNDFSVTLPVQFQTSFQDFLSKNPKNRNEFPLHCYYFKDLDNFFFCDKPNNHSTILNYIEVVQLYKIFREKADHTHQSSLGEETLIFLGKKKLCILNDFTGDDFINISKINLFKTHFVDVETHKEQIKNIIIDSINNYYENLQAISYTDIIRDFEKIYECIKNNYDTYQAEFSYEKIKKEVDQYKTDTVARINKIYSDIQAQLITIPASVILVAGQLKTGKDSSVIANSVILFGALFFSISVWHLVNNQKDTLKTILHEIEEHKKKIIESRDPSYFKKFAGQFTFLEQRYYKQRKNLHLVKVGISIAFLVTLFIFIIFTYIDYDFTYKDNFINFFVEPKDN